MFLVNRSYDETIDLTMTFKGLAPAATARAYELFHPNPVQCNTNQAPQAVALTESVMALAGEKAAGQASFLPWPQASFPALPGLRGVRALTDRVGGVTGRRRRRFGVRSFSSALVPKL